MKADAEITRQFDALLALSEQLLQTRSRRENGLADCVDSQLAAQWGTSTLAMIERVYGPESVYAEKFREHSQYVYIFDHARNARGVLQSAREDWANGWVRKIQHLVEAEIFVDLLAQAEHLLSKDHYVPAAVLGGAVLEDCLRRLCVRHKIDLPETATMAPMNDALHKHGAYSKVMWAEVAAKGHLRNHAAHGQIEKFTKADVEAMLPFVRRFLADHHG